MAELNLKKTIIESYDLDKLKRMEGNEGKGIAKLRLTSASRSLATPLRLSAMLKSSLLLLRQYISSRRLLRQIQVPLHDLLEDALTSSFNHIAVTGNNPLKVPLVNPLHRLRVPHPIARANPPPNQPLLPIPPCIRQRAKDLRQYPTRRAHASLAELLGRRVVEDQVGLDERLGRLVVEDELLVLVRVHELVFEFGIEVGVDGGEGLGLREDVGEGDVFVLLLCALFGEAFGAQDFCVGVGSVPWAEEDVVLYALLVDAE